MSKVPVMHNALNISSYIDVTAFVSDKFREMVAIAVGTYSSYNLGAWDNQVPWPLSFLFKPTTKDPIIESHALVTGDRTWTL